MKVKYGFKTYEEAAKEARALVSETGKKSGSPIRETVIGLDEDTKDFSYIENEETGATAYIGTIDGEEYKLTFIPGEICKEDNKTFPYRGVSKRNLPFLMYLGTPVYKPIKEINPDEAFTLQGMRDIYSFLGLGYEPFIKREEWGEYDKENAFEYWGDEDIGSLLFRPFPSDVEEETGIKVGDPSDYTRGIAKILKTEFSEEEKRQAEETFLYYTAEALLMYAIYEFLRTESYDRLSFVLSQYGEFYLPEKWERDFLMFYEYRRNYNKDFSAEEYVLAKYISKWHSDIIKLQVRMREISEFTGAPLPILARAFRIKRIFDF